MAAEGCGAVFRKFNPLTFVIVLLVAVNVYIAVVAAQDATEAPTTDPAANIQPTVGAIPTGQPAVQPEIIGDANQESVQIVVSYLQTRDPNLLAENAEFFDLTTGQPVVGRDPITQLQNSFYGQAFTGTLVQPNRVIVADDGWVVVEFNFSGVHTGDFRNVPATNLPVALPMAGIFHVEDGLITNMRLYYDAATINQQLGIGSATSMIPGGGTNTNSTSELTNTTTSSSAGAAEATEQPTPLSLDTLLDDPEAFYGQTVTVDGTLTQFINERMLILTDDDLIAPDSLLVLHHVEGLAVDQNARVQVTGMVRPFVLADIESEFGIDLDDAQFADYENQSVLIADAVTPVQ